MKFAKSWRNLAFDSLVLCGLGSVFLGCGQATSPVSAPASTCSSANQAVIGVGEGLMYHLCGCQGAGETPGTQVSSGQTLTCHLAQSDTQVVFYFGQPIGSHQILADGSPSLAGTPWVQGGAQLPIAYPVSLGQSGATFSFKDVTSGVKGQIIVP